MPSSDPRIFGPPTWTCLHILAENYPEEASLDLRIACILLLFSLARMLPCRRCSDHFREFLRENHVAQATRGKKDLVALLVAAHNNIAEHTRPNEPPYPVACAKQQYAYMRPRACPLPQLY
uniref:thiol oxidase n=1 Tax=viral metagenome TaxID=1070528 RepID=A0A6C0BZL4_9ZZZZ